MSRLVVIELTSLLTALIGALVWLRNRGNAGSLYFACFSASVAFWTAVNGFVHSFGSTSWGSLLARSTFFAASFIPVTFHLFATSFASFPASRLIVWLQRFWVVLGTSIAVLSLTPWMVTGATIQSDALVVSYGPLHLPFALFFAACLVSALCLLIYRRKHLAGLQRTQATCIIGGVLFTAAGASITNLWLPLLFGNSRYGQYSAIFTALLVLVIAHTMIRHRLMNVRIVIRRGVVHLASYVIVGLLLAAALASLLSTLPTLTVLSVTPLLLLIAAVFHPVELFTRRLIERYLSREPYNYQRIVRDTSRQFISTVEILNILDYLQQAIQRSLRPSSIAVYLFDEVERSFSLVLQGGPRTYPSRVTPSAVILEALSSSPGPMIRGALAPTLAPHYMASVTRGLLDLDAEVLTPLVEANSIVGLVVLGPRPLDNPYFPDDADLLATLANQSAVAIRNAQTHQQVLQLNEELQTVLSTIDSGVVTVGSRGEIRLFNRAAERFTGVPADAASGQRADVLPAPLANCIAGTLADGEPRLPVEFAVPDSAGQLVPLVCSTFPLLGAADHLDGVVAVINDISHLKELEHEKRRAERLAYFEATAAGLVHEIRNPLVAIKTFTQLLPTRYHDAEYREACARTVGREIRRMDNLLTRFRTLSAASAEPTELVDVREPMWHAVDVLRPQLEERRIRVRRVCDGTPRRIIGNVSQLEQLFLNLCLNALEATPPEGEITLRVADLADGGGSTLLVEISDTGTGLPEDLLDKIFDPFVSTKARGSGLGLAICRAVADAHHACLTARNNENRPGCTFTVEFPVPLPQPATPTGP